MRLTLLADLVEDRERALVVAQVVEALAEEELRLLHVGRRVLRLTLDDALELHGALLVFLLLVEAQRVRERLRRRTFGRRSGRLPGLVHAERHVLRRRRYGDRDQRERGHGAQPQDVLVSGDPTHRHPPLRGRMLLAAGARR